MPANVKNANEQYTRFVGKNIKNLIFIFLIQVSSNSLQDARSTPCFFMAQSNDIAALRVFKSYVRPSVQYELAIISAFDSIDSCMSSSTTGALCSELTSSGCVGSAMSFKWRNMLRPDEYLMLSLLWMDQINEALSLIRVSNWSS